MDRSSKTYLDELRQRLPGQHPMHGVLGSSRNYAQRVYHAGSENLTSENATELQKILGPALQDFVNDQQTVCVIENIHPEWIEALGSALDIPHEFFIDHAANASGQRLWHDITSSGRYESPSTAAASGHEQCHIEGMLLHLEDPDQSVQSRRFPHRFEWDAIYGWQSNTRISYCRVKTHFYACGSTWPSWYLTDYLDLFLVDQGLLMQKDTDQVGEIQLMPSRLSSWVGYSLNRGGLPIPQLYERASFALFDVMQSFLSHDWQWSVLFHDEHAVSPAVFLHFLSASTWKTNLRFLARKTKRIAFREIRRPNKRINDMLHDIRHHLDTLQIEVALARDHIPSEVTEHRLCKQGELYKTPLAIFREVYEGSSALERFLMDTFQLLMSSISVLDSQTSIQQGQRSTQLTLLATLYVPLSFVTGIFGMNVREIDDSGHSIWQFVVTQIVVLICTAALPWLVHALLKSEKGATKSGKDERSKSKV